MKAIVEIRVYDARLKAVAITVVLGDSGWTAEGAYRKNEATVRHLERQNSFGVGLHEGRSIRFGSRPDLVQPGEALSLC
jgi:hypothetical protein